MLLIDLDKPHPTCETCAAWHPAYTRTDPNRGDCYLLPHRIAKWKDEFCLQHLTAGKKEQPLDFHQAAN